VVVSRTTTVASSMPPFAEGQVFDRGIPWPGKLDVLEAIFDGGKPRSHVPGILWIFVVQTRMDGSSLRWSLSPTAGSDIPPPPPHHLPFCVTQGTRQKFLLSTLTAHPQLQIMHPVLDSEESAMR
jgi:hypothetical protein